MLAMMAGAKISALHTFTPRIGWFRSIATKNALSGLQSQRELLAAKQKSAQTSADSLRNTLAIQCGYPTGTEITIEALPGVTNEQLAAIDKVLEMDKEQFIRLKKDEIIPFIEEELAVRYFYQKAGVKLRLRYDTQLKEPLTLSYPKALL